MKNLIALATVLGISALSTDAFAAPPKLSGWGTRDLGTHHSSFMGSLELQANGAVTGHLTIVLNNDGEEQVVCRYLRFRQNAIQRNSWNFDAFGVCFSASTGYYSVSNRVVLIDYGSPGAGIDYVDINFYGPVGVSVPGGYIDDGEWTYL
jgi:hypothetical protein